MRIYIAGHGAREAYLTELAREKGYSVNGEGPWDFVVLELPRSEMAKELAARLPAGQRIVCGQASPALEQAAQDGGWRLLPILKDERFTLENAVLSAEGAVYFAMRQADFSLCRAHCAVVGYGRIGQALTRMLRGLGAQVTVVARRQESRDAAGPGSVGLEALGELLPRVQVLFSTVPAPVIGKELLALAPENALLLELASPPYGIDLAAAQEMGLRAWLESGIPGRYCPKDAARAVLNYLERSEEHE